MLILIKIKWIMAWKYNLLEKQQTKFCLNDFVFVQHRQPIALKKIF